LRKTVPISSYLTLASGGYIIRMRPTAMGMDVVPTLNSSSKGTMPGNTYPAATPTPMARKIQTVR
jgi:hypothetical protein